MPKTTKTIQITNKYLDFIITYLAAIKIDGQVAFARRRFLRDLKEFQNDLTAEREELKKEYCDKDSKEKPILDDGKYKFSKDKRKLFNEKWKDLNEVGFLYEISAGNEVDYKAMKKLISEQIKNLEAKSNGEFDAVSFDLLETLREFAKLLK